MSIGTRGNSFGASSPFFFSLCGTREKEAKREKRCRLSEAPPDGAPHYLRFKLASQRLPTFAISVNKKFIARRLPPVVFVGEENGLNHGGHGAPPREAERDIAQNGAVRARPFDSAQNRRAVPKDFFQPRKHTKDHEDRESKIGSQKNDHDGTGNQSRPQQGV